MEISLLAFEKFCPILELCLWQYIFTLLVETKQWDYRWEFSVRWYFPSLWGFLRKALVLLPTCLGGG